MKWNLKHFLSALIIIFMLSSTLLAKQIEKHFDAVKKVNIDLVLSDCRISASKDDKIHVTVAYTYDDDQYEVRFKERGSRLTMKEDFHGNDHDGTARWEVKIPQGIKVEFETATGDLELSDLEKVDLEGNSGTGDLQMEACSGDFDLNTGTGDVNVTDCQGSFDLNSGTGDVEISIARGEFDVNSGTGTVLAANITIEEEAEFNSGTGEAKVVHPLGDDYDLSISSGTDDAILDMDGLPIKGYFEFTANNRRGDIVCPVKFDREDIYENGDGDYQRKSFTRGGESPRYFISTGTGEAELKK